MHPVDVRSCCSKDPLVPVQVHKLKSLEEYIYIYQEGSDDVNRGAKDVSTTS